MFKLTITLDIPDQWVNGISGPGHVLLSERVLSLRQALAGWMDVEPLDPDAVWLARLDESHGWYELEQLPGPIVPGCMVSIDGSVADIRRVVAIEGTTAWVATGRTARAGGWLVDVSRLRRVG